MLTEYNVSQQAGQPYRRWFADDELDLIVWFSDQAQFLGFQLCYNKKRQEQVITWTPEQGFQHGVLDSGESSVWKNQTPLVKAIEPPPTLVVRDEFLNRSTNLPREIRNYVLDKFGLAVKPARPGNLRAWIARYRIDYTAKLLRAVRGEQVPNLKPKSIVLLLLLALVVIALMVILG